MDTGGEDAMLQILYRLQTRYIDECSSQRNRGLSILGSGARSIRSRGLCERRTRCEMQHVV